MREEIS